MKAKELAERFVGGITTAEAESLVREAGFKPAATFEDEGMLVAQSAKAVPGTFGHPAFAVLWNKRTGLLTVEGVGAVRVAKGMTP